MIAFSFPDTPLFRKAAIDFLNGNNSSEIENVAPDFPKIDLSVSQNNEAENNSDVKVENDEDESQIGNDVICPWTGERLDCEGGYPWNARIHGAKKSKLAKTNEWKLIKGIEIRSPGLVKEIRDEFDARRNAAKSKGMHTPNPAPSIPSAPPAPQSLFPAPEPESPRSAAPPIPTPPAPPAELVELPENPSYSDILAYVTSRVAVNDDYQESVTSVLEKFKLTDISQLTGMTPANVKAFGQWLSYEWQMLAV